MPREIRRFERFKLDVTNETLKAGNTVVPLQPMQMKLLIVLTNTPGALVAYEVIKNELWKGANVSKEALPFQLSKLREALEDPTDGPRQSEPSRKKGSSSLRM
jgi:DNA-binding winged helix-turn-helix (wHTH) protein